MGRKTRIDRVLRIRFRDEEGTPKTSLVFSNNPKSARDRFGGGKVLRVGKYRPEEIYKVGEFNQMADRLMKEFAQDDRNKQRRLDSSAVERGYDRIAKERQKPQENEA
jgi:hypothetical protein